MSASHPPRRTRRREGASPTKAASSGAAGERRSPAPKPEERIQQMMQGVRAAGLKLTPQRMAIVRAFASDPSHPTAQEIFDRLRPAMPTMSFATVYNTLGALTEAGLCGSLSLSPGPARFDPNMAPHHHAVCDGCGLVRDVARSDEPVDTADVERTIRQRGEAPALSGFEVRAVEHIYRGLCAMCSARARMDGTSEGRARPPAPRSIPKQDR